MTPFRRSLEENESGGGRQEKGVRIKKGGRRKSGVEEGNESFSALYSGNAAFPGLPATTRRRKTPLNPTRPRGDAGTKARRGDGPRVNRP